VDGYRLCDQSTTTTEHEWAGIERLEIRKSRGIPGFLMYISSTVWKDNHTMRKIHTIVIASAAMLAASSTSFGGINGLHENPRVFNDFPGSILTITNTNTVNPGMVTIDDRRLTGSGFANRHDVLLSSDHGVSAHTFSIDDSFTFSAEVTLDTGLNAPRKEAGLRINSPVTGDAFFLINSDAGEIVAFGGGTPFHIFGNNGGGTGYTVGDTILMGFTYTASGGGADGVPGTMEYFIDRGSGIESTGPLAWSNAEGGPSDFEVGVYAMISPGDESDFATATFNTITFVPAPGSLALLALGGLALRRRR
jgi:hypothetical protein